MFSMLLFSMAVMVETPSWEASGVYEIVAGSTTVEEVEARIGPGAKMTGGHPLGGRVWFVPDSGRTLFLDGFDYNASGRVIDRVVLRKVEISSRDTDLPSPKGRLHRQKGDRYGLEEYIGRARPSLPRYLAPLYRVDSQGRDYVRYLSMDKAISRSIEFRLSNGLVSEVWFNYIY